MPEQVLDREEYIEQTYFFRVYRDRLLENVPAQEILAHLREEILATTKLPMAIDFLAGELQLHGKVSSGMSRLTHYFTPFQAFVIGRAEADESKFDMRLALQILEREAEFRAGKFHLQGLFMFQFECLARNRLGYDAGMQAIAADPAYDASWKDWILKIRMQLGTVDFADLIYKRSQQRVEEIRRERNNPSYEASYPILFGVSEGRIAKANLRKDPIYMFAALQRQLSYPAVPRPKPPRTTPVFDPAIEARFQRAEARLALLEQEGQGNLDLTKFYKPEEFRDGEMN
ncbi:hypothetical protein Pan44_21220 [Caulifigura coniformis]|uniref:Uncharacterized protein n=1 Tax=Caulifigura coniformis TaxID=2527983 RepID=A0A517SDB3_9PLAN|nr:hypothetical protein [Caulifigura coniformis]QDT54095.1 hypothetical protein Pan44_21220 [Caulifigura coniformis]